MDKIFDTFPFAYVGNNKHYENFSKEDLEELKKTNIKKEELPSSDEVEESSASTIGQMLPQVDLESEEPDVDNVLTDIDDEVVKDNEGDNDMYYDDEFDLLRESLNDTINGGEIYFESASFIETLKNKFKKDDVTSTQKINHGKVMKAAKAYTDMRLSVTRIKLAVTKDSKIKGTPNYKQLQKKAINAEKEYRKIKKELSKDELEILNQYIDGFDSTFNKKVDAQIADIKEAKKATIKKESVENEGCKTEGCDSSVITEKDLDPEMKPLIEKLHKKGYETAASSSGHNNLVAKDDSNKNGVRDGRLYSDARLVFKGKYDLGKAPKYWYWKKVDNDDEVDYLDIEQIKYDTTPGGPSKAFQDWKIKYMRSLTDWIDELPDISNVDNKEEKEEVEEACETESTIDINEEIDTLFESVMSDIEFDILTI